MAASQTSDADPDHRVIAFRPRTMAHPPSSASASAPASDLTQYERGPADPDEYRHRMATNAAAIGFATLLTLAGIWLATSIADLRQSQDCVLMGRRNCATMPALSATPANPAVIDSERARDGGVPRH